MPITIALLTPDPRSPIRGGALAAAVGDDHLQPTSPAPMGAMHGSAVKEPQVGIFWGLRDGIGPRVLLHAGCPLAQAEVYGDCLTYPAGHHEVWDGWRRLGDVELRRRGLLPALRDHEYDAVPRGRIVYETGARWFILYADRRLQAAEFIQRVRAVFGLAEAAVRVRSDAHYRTSAGA